MEGGREAKYVLRDIKAAFSFILFRVHFSVSSCRVETPVIKCVANLATGDTVCQVVRRRKGDTQAADRETDTVCGRKKASCSTNGLGVLPHIILCPLL